MAPKNYFQVIAKHKITVISAVILCGLASFVYAYVKPQSFSSTVSMSFHRINKEATNDFQYDNYYSAKAVEIISNTAVGWLETPNVVLEIFEKANVVPDDIYKETKKITPKQTSAHEIQARIVNPKRENAEKLSNALVTVMQDKVKQLEINSDNKNSFDLIAEKPIVTEIKYNPLMLTLIGLVAGLFLGIGLAFVWEYFKDTD